MDKETLEFDVVLTSTYWRKKPQFRVLLDGQTVVEDTFAYLDAEFSQHQAKEHHVTFSRELEEGDHTLSIELLNKEPSDTLLKEGEIFRDMLLHVDKILIDGVDIGNLLRTESCFYPAVPTAQEGQTSDTCYTNYVNIGHNGRWDIKLTLPFYIWLLERL